MILEFCEQQQPMFSVVEVGESWFGTKRVKGKHGRGAYGQTTVFGIYERNGVVIMDWSISAMVTIVLIIQRMNSPTGQIISTG